ncbi:MAG: hypothetical protein GC179_30735 [Anaerolineaceae bacterium]|nr:hypothetical protein [Anaerolineaceae bacterium]
MRNLKITLTKGVEAYAAQSQLKDLLAKEQIPPQERDTLIENASKTIDTMVESGDRLISQGCNFNAKQQVKSASCTVIIQADYRMKPPSLIEKIFNMFRQ